MFHKIRRLKSRHQFAYSLVIGFGIGGGWRGIWGFMDLYLFPNSLDLSILTSLALGITILFITHNHLS